MGLDCFEQSLGIGALLSQASGTETDMPQDWARQGTDAEEVIARVAGGEGPGDVDMELGDGDEATGNEATGGTTLAADTRWAGKTDASEGTDTARLTEARGPVDWDRLVECNSPLLRPHDGAGDGGRLWAEHGLATCCDDRTLG